MTDPASGRGGRLEDLKPGVLVTGLVAAGTVTVVAVAPHGPDTLTLTWRDPGGGLGEQLVFRHHEGTFAVESPEAPWSFEADGSLWKLAAEARRIRLAHLFDPMLAVHLSQLEPLPHQIQAVYGHLLPRQPLRFLLADDPGAGKTIMAGLYIKELMLRGDVARCLIVAPGGLVAQWQDELAERFDLDFTILTREAVEAAYAANPFLRSDRLICRLDHLARNDVLAQRLTEGDWDLVVVDEAHRMAAHWFGAEVKETRRYRLGRLLGSITRHFLLLTATPHTGKEDDFELFLALLDADRFEGRHRSEPGGGGRPDLSDVMRRKVKEELYHFDGRPLFPERVARTVAYPLSPPEQALYDEVTAYVVEEMSRADRLADAGEGRRGNRVGFALTVLQRRLASSPEAIYQSLRRRRERLETRLAEERAGRISSSDVPAADQVMSDLESDDDSSAVEDLDDAEVEALEEDLVDQASAARTVAELEAEIAILTRLEAMARRVRDSGTDRKWTELARMLDDEPELRDVSGSRRKLIVFSEHRDTLNALVERLRTKLGRAEAVVAMHGGTSRVDRRAIQETFTSDPDCVVLVATDAAGEGINLQRANLVVNYDLPWNPNRIEQRFGRIHRIGQSEVCFMWNLVADSTREGEVYLRLLSKLAQQAEDLGGQVFDVLGEAFRGQPLRDLLLQAIRYGERPDVRARLEQVIDERVGEGLAELINERALAADVLGAADLEHLRAQMDEAAARRLQPHFVAAFFAEALALVGGRAAEREAGRYEVTHVPAGLRGRPGAARGTIGRGAESVAVPVLHRYERICFDKDRRVVLGRPLAELVCPGHPLLDALIDSVLTAYGATLREGAVLVDDTDLSDAPYALVMLEHAICDGRTDAAGRRREVSRRFEFVRVDPTGQASRAGGAAPYLDFRPATEAEVEMLGPLRSAGWLSAEIEAAAVDAAVRTSVPEHLAEVSARTLDRVERTRRAVWERLTREVEHWDARANELAEQAAAGTQPRMNPERARARAEELASRRTRRLAELDAEAALQALPPVVSGGALVIPAGWLAARRGEPVPEAHAAQVALVDRRAVDAVLAAEAALGRRAEEMAHNNPGFDIRSTDDDGHLTFIEVKGRIVGAPSVTVSRSQILTGLNSPERFVLALVEVDLTGTDTVRYVRCPFEGVDLSPFRFPATAVSFDWDELWAGGGDPS
jgi:SNF2 family DNA or RNA helicase